MTSQTPAKNFCSSCIYIYTGWFRNLCRCLRGHITRTPMTTRMAPVPNSTSSHVAMHGSVKKQIYTIYCWFAADLRKKCISELFASIWKSEKVAHSTFFVFCMFRRTNCPLFFLSFFLSLSLSLSLPSLFYDMVHRSWMLKVCVILSI
jgi:hypothetical protein